MGSAALWRSLRTGGVVPHALVLAVRRRVFNILLFQEKIRLPSKRKGSYPNSLRARSGIPTDGERLCFAINLKRVSLLLRAYAVVWLWSRSVVCRT